MITRVCASCGREYRTYPSVKPKYCSTACAGDAKRTGETVACTVCGAAVWSFRSRPRQFCSKRCARIHANKTNPPLPRFGADNPMFGKGLSGEANGMFGRRRELAPRWKGGRKVRPDGYVRVLAPADHPHPCEVRANGTKYILEHRLVMERHLGRYLLPTEVVHHIDENPSNNAIGNLRLFASQAEHLADGHG